MTAERRDVAGGGLYRIDDIDEDCRAMGDAARCLMAMPPHRRWAALCWLYSFVKAHINDPATAGAPK